jgi:small-conductance mechanosensitive channel
MEGIESLVTSEQLFGILRAVLTMVGGFVLARILRTAVGRVTDARASPQHAMLARRASYYFVLSLAAVSALREMGFDFSVLLGAAGVASVAIGFAAQTSAANLISGLFLMSERPFVLGEVIEVEGTTGEVLSIDLLSVKLRTFDNLFVRIPNESLVKAQIKNLTRHPIRRYDMQVGVAYAENLPRVRELLLSVADENSLCLREPRPIVIFQGFGDSSVNLQLSVWGATSNYLALRNSIAEGVKQALDSAGIELPFPHRSLYAGAHTEPLPVAIVSRPDPGGTS